MAAAKTVERKVVGVDQYNWLIPAPDTKKGTQVCSAARGEVIQISVDEAKRGESIIDPTTGVAALGDVDAEVPTDAAPTVTAEALSSMDVEDALAHLGQLPEDEQADLKAQLVELEHDRDEADQRQAILALDPDYEAADPADAAGKPTSES